MSEIVKKFNEERKSRQLAEDKALELEKKLKLVNSDIKYLKEDLIKKEKDFNDEIVKYMSVKKELDLELLKRTQELSEFNSEISNLKIKEKHLTKIVQEVKEENGRLKEEGDKLRKISLETENNKIKKLQDEIDELKTMNQLYRSQRLESEEEINTYVREKEKIKSDFTQLKKEL